MSFLVTTATVRRGHLVSAASNNATTHPFTEIQTRMKRQLIARIANQFFPLLRTPPIMHPLLTERVSKAATTTITIDKDYYEFSCYNNNCQKRPFSVSGVKQCHNASVHRNSNKDEEAAYCEDCKSVFPTFADATDHASTTHREGVSVKSKEK
ncbi:hypothetical protein POM88_039548 [Heracleum sosnowskyi]|uniref:Uncharacterized protein n=1 Tax=Heracleum sosnowskyi TaxID=360622 RepID=A0AAD8HDA8_9APIA|nr:hypothetical protein POM88_039548 [Heracleum sosnowskyi]